MVASTEKALPIPWTHQETLHLIEAYQQKWYSLDRANLKSPQWEEIAVTVAARCGYHRFDPSKTSLQCRHKMEKLRQRYRSEKHRLSHGALSDWQYFDLIHNLLQPPRPISALPCDYAEEQSDRYNRSDEEREVRRKSKRISSILQRRAAAVPADGSSRGGGDMAAAAEEEEEREREREKYWRMAAEIRGFGERLMEMENRKMEIVKESERKRMEMESKRMEMILESEHKIVDSIERAFGISKR